MAAEMVPPLLSLVHLSYAVDNQTILNDIHFDVARGERVAVFGHSGAGKSTLIRLLNRLDEPTAGTVLLNGQDYREIDPRTLRQKIGMVMQQPYLFPGTVADNILYGPQVQGRPMDRASIETLLAEVELPGFADREVSSLSGGEAQRVSLARTLANDPDVLLLDEPTSSLDQSVKRDIERLILKIIEEEGVTCILVSHDRDQVRRMADRVIKLEEGRMIAVGSTEEVLDA